MVTINTSPGNRITLVVQIVDGYGTRADGYQAPQVDYFLNPSNADILGGAVFMTKVGTGIYRRSFTLPSGASTIGTYIASVSWPHPDTARFQYDVFLIQVSLPFGNSSVSPA